MTLTETRPEPDTETAPEPVAVARETWLTTSDHKTLGLLYLGFSLLFLLTGGILALVLRGQLAEGEAEHADRGLPRTGRADRVQRDAEFRATLGARWRGAEARPSPPRDDPG